MVKLSALWTGSFTPKRGAISAKQYFRQELMEHATVIDILNQLIARKITFIAIKQGLHIAGSRS